MPIIPLENVYMVAGESHQKKNLAILKLRLLVWHVAFCMSTAFVSDQFKAFFFFLNVALVQHNSSKDGETELRSKKPFSTVNQ